MVREKTIKNKYILHGSKVKINPWCLKSDNMGRKEAQRIFLLEKNGNVLHLVVGDSFIGLLKLI